ncbi:MAG: DnaJ family domain-containing protein [Rubrivivax sp.]
MSAMEERAQRLQLLDDHIGQALRDSEASGELRAAPSYGKPLAAAEGYDETPEELRLGMKILKDAGVVPPEVELMQRIAALQAEADAQADPAQAQALRQRVTEWRQALALRLEALQRTGRW